MKPETNGYIPYKGFKVYYETYGPADSPEAPLLVDPDGNKVPEEAVVEHLKFARVTRLGIESNAGFCRGLLAARYGIEDPEEETA